MNPDPTKYEPDPGLRAPRDRLRYLNLALAGVAAAGVLFSVLLIARSAGESELWKRDWYCLWSVGRAFLAGQRSGFYLVPCAPGYSWLYPPYFLYPWAAIAQLPAFEAYLAIVALSLGAYALASVLLSRALPAERSLATVTLAGAASAAFNSNLLTGQHAALLLVAVSGALWSARRDRQVATGLFVALLGFKPNWVIVFVLWLAVSRRWTALATTIVAGALMVASTLPMGVDIWTEYLSIGGDRASIALGLDAGGGSYPPWKLITAEAFLRSLLGPSALQRALAALSGIVVLSACVLVWLRRVDVRSQLSVAVLAAVAANPYASFYDALVLVVPAAVWWTAPSLYTRRTRLVVGVSAVGVWVVQWVVLYGLRGAERPSLVGGVVLVWLGAESWRALFDRRSGVEAGCLGICLEAQANRLHPVDRDALGTDGHFRG